MLVNVTGSNKGVRTLVNRAAWWYAEKLMGTRLMAGLEIDIKLDRNLLKKSNNEGSAIWEDDTRRPKEFTIKLDSTCNIRNILITLAHEMVHIKQWAKDEMYEYYNTPKTVRFKGEKFNMHLFRMTSVLMRWLRMLVCILRASKQLSTLNGISLNNWVKYEWS